MPDAVEQAVTKALAKVPADRFATASQLADALELAAAAAVQQERGRKRRRLMKSPVLWLVGCLILATAGGAVMLYPSTTIPFDTRDWILITDFENETGDSVFDGSLNTAFTVGVAQSRHINVFPRSRVAQVLELMGQEDVGALSGSLGLEVALRASIRVVVVPVISRVDSVYMITTRIVDPATGSDLRSRSIQATGKAEVLASLDKLARKLRRDLGESILAVAQRGVRLDHATTPSLEALRAWSEGNRHWNEGRYDLAGVLYNRAVELDSSFAMAHVSLGGYYLWWEGNRPQSDLHFDKALSLLDRVTERERLEIQATVYGYREDREAQINTLQIYLARYPDDLNQRYNLGTAYMRAGRYEEAISTLEQVLEADSSSASAYINVATSYHILGAHAEALPYYLKAFELQPEWLVSVNLNHEFGFNYVGMGDLEAAEQTFQRMLSESPGQQAKGHRSLALLRTYSGKYAVAIPHFRRAILLDQTIAAPLSEFRDRLYLVAAFRAKGALQDAQRELAAARELADSIPIEPDWLKILAKQLARGGSVAEAIELRELITARMDQDNRRDKAALSLVTGEIALAEGDFAEAIRQLEMSCALFPTWKYHLESLAYGYLVSGDLVAAQAKYEELVARPLLAGEAQEYWILAHYQLGRIHEEKGETAKAIEYYRRFLDIWKAGDEDLINLQDAKRRLAQLSPAQQ